MRQPNASQLIRNDNSSNNITTSAYLQLTSNVLNETVYAQIYNSSSNTLVLAVGPSGSEVDTLYIMPSQNNVVIPLKVAAKTRLSVKAVATSTTTGELTINLFN